jgi:hypothetical protein
MEGIITGEGKGSMGSWRKVERGGHETEEKDEKSKKGSPTARGVEGSGIVYGSDAEETHAEEERTPHIPALPETEEAERDESDREKDGGVTVKAGAEGTEDVAAVELGNGEEIDRSGEEADPGGAADGVKQEGTGGNAGMQGGGE